MQRSISAALTILLAFVSVATTRALGGDGCCAHCNCPAPCHKVCRLVCEEKKVDVTCWGCKCEDFCLPDHSQPGCQHCEVVCDDEDCSSLVCTQPKNFVWTEWIPGCATIHTKKKLMKKVVSKKVPSYKWVVEDLCERCQAQCPTPAIGPGVVIPPPPLVH